MSSRLSLLVDLAALLTREVDLDALLSTACQRMAEALHAERATVWLTDASKGELFARVAVLPEVSALRQPLDRGLAAHVARTGETVRLDDAASDPRFDPSVDRVTGFTTRSMLVAPIRDGARGPVRGAVQVLNHERGAFDEEDERFLVALTAQLARALALTTLRAEDASGPGVTLRGPFNRIVGRSKELDRVYESVARAAETDATVLLRGETGTGKGLFARAVHVNSARQTGPFVTVDCTTLPAQLVESELFGHERGAFTGAERRVPGKVELADGGTLFLDEIGDMPLELQGKLLRFLQERTFERVGGRTTQKVDVRLVCATHRDLAVAVREGRFREDLYYRVRVVEIELPTLRARGGDEIDALARHFADMYAERYGRPRPELSPELLAALRAHTWPGNVRELEHWMESAVVLAPRGVIDVTRVPSVARVGGAVGPAAGEGGASHVSDAASGSGGAGAPVGIHLPLGLDLDEVARRYLEATLRAADGNKTEAAKRLGIGRNTVTRLLKG